MAINEILGKMIDESMEKLGEEKMEEIMEDNEFVYETFEKQIFHELKNAIAAIILDADIEECFMAMFLAGVNHYRDWLSEKGVDVRLLEGRK